MEYSPELGDAICELITEGNSIRTICSAENMPAMSSIFKWLRLHPEFAEQYARAKEIQADSFAEEILDISDDGTNDWMTKRFGETEVEMPNPEVLQRSKLRVDTRKWLMSKMLPKKYGEKMDLNHGGELAIKSILVPERIATERSPTDLKPNFEA